MEYTYCPEKITEGGIDQMRFELGDTMVEGGKETCLLCDAEYQALLGQAKTWQKAKISCLKAIVMKLSYEVDYKVDNMSLSLSKRYEQLKKQLEELEQTAQIPMIANGLARGEGNGTPYFYLGMQENPKAGR